MRLVAAALLLLLARPAQADLLLPADFNPIRNWQLQPACRTFPFFTTLTTFTTGTGCISGEIDLGQNTTTHQFGVVWSFSKSVTGSIPADGSTILLFVDGFALENPTPPFGVGVMALLFNDIASTGTFYSANLNGNLQQLDLALQWVGVDAYTGPPDVQMLNNDLGSLFQLTPTPEPSTFALILGGFAMIALVTLRARRRR